MFEVKARSQEELLHATDDRSQEDRKRLRAAEESPGISIAQTWWGNMYYSKSLVVYIYILRYIYIYYNYSF